MRIQLYILNLLANTELYALEDPFQEGLLRSPYLSRLYKTPDDSHHDPHILIPATTFSSYSVLILRLGINFRNVGKETGSDLANVSVAAANDRSTEHSCASRTHIFRTDMYEGQSPPHRDGGQHNSMRLCCRTYTRFRRISLVVEVTLLTSYTVTLLLK